MKNLILTFTILISSLTLTANNATVEYCKDEKVIEIVTKKGLTKLKVISITKRGAGKKYVTSNGYRIYVVGGVVMGFEK